MVWWTALSAVAATWCVRATFLSHPIFVRPRPGYANWPTKRPEPNVLGNASRREINAWKLRKKNGNANSTHRRTLRKKLAQRTYQAILERSQKNTDEDS